MRSHVGWILGLFVAFLLGLALPMLIDGKLPDWERLAVWLDRAGFSGPASDLGRQPGRMQLWTCGMHPQVVQTEPGSCPICHMDLVPVRDAEADAERQESRSRLWTCGMHPQVVQTEPGSCPICHMDLVPVRDAEAEAEPSRDERRVLHWRAPMDPTYISDKPGKSPMGMDLVPVYEEPAEEPSGIRVDPHFLQNFSIRSARVEKGRIPRLIRTIATLHYNPRTMVSINTKFEGWIEAAHVNTLGQPVSQGDLLFEIFSPQLLTTQQEYLAALQFLERLGEQARPKALQRARALVEAAHRRLLFWDVTEDQVRRLKTQGKASRRLKIASPVSGVVVEQAAESLEGMKVSPGMNLYRIADPSTVWAQVEIFQHDMRHLRMGQKVRIGLDTFPERKWQGAVVSLNPELDPRTRTLGVQVEIPNGDGRLRSEMVAEVELEIPGPASALKVPEEAVLHSGERSLVIVQKESNLFEPREVELGAAGGGFQEIRRGLSAGERVVTSSQFLIDSESNLREAINRIAARARSSREGRHPEDHEDH